MNFNREQEWENFSLAVRGHIVGYTIPQYGDAPDDQLAEFSVADCMTQIKRYANRAGRNARGQKEDLRDILKIAHYSAVAFFKLRERINVLGEIPVQTEAEKGRS